MAAAAMVRLVGIVEVVVVCKSLSGKCLARQVRSPLPSHCVMTKAAVLFARS